MLAMCHTVCAVMVVGSTLFSELGIDPTGLIGIAASSNRGHLRGLSYCHLPAFAGHRPQRGNSTHDHLTTATFVLAIADLALDIPFSCQLSHLTRRHYDVFLTIG